MHSNYPQGYATALSRQGVAENHAKMAAPLTGTESPLARPRMAMQLDHLAKLISSCHEFASELENAVDRISGCVPTPTSGKDVAVPVPSSIEQKLNEAISFTESLAARLQNTSQRISSSV